MSQSEEVLTRDLPPLPEVLDGSYESLVATQTWIAHAAKLITDLRYTVLGLEQNIDQTRAHIQRLAQERSEFSELWDTTAREQANPMAEHMFLQAITGEVNF